MDNLGQMILKLRKINGWKQEDLSSKMSEMLGKPVSRSSISHWENGERAPNKKNLDCLLKLIASSFGKGVTDRNSILDTEVEAGTFDHRIPIIDINKISEIPWKKSLESEELYIKGHLLGPGKYVILEISEEVQAKGVISLGKKAFIKLQDYASKGDLSAIMIKKIRKALIARAYESREGLVFIEDEGKDGRLWKSREVIIFGKVLYYINKA